MEMIIEPSKQVPPSKSIINVWAIAGEIGLIIALPLVFLILIGVKVDRLLNTTPLFIIVALIFSMVISTITIVRKVKQVTK